MPCLSMSVMQHYCGAGYLRFSDPEKVCHQHAQRLEGCATRIDVPNQTWFALGDTLVFLGDLGA
jgi:hypothetical protein